MYNLRNTSFYFSNSNIYKCGIQFLQVKIDFFFDVAFPENQNISYINGRGVMRELYEFHR